MLTPEQVTGLVSYIGIVMQLGGALLLAVLFYLLHRQARRRRWFTMWGFAWAFLCAAIAALAIRYNGLAGIGRTLLPEDSAAVQGLYFVYQWGKLLSCGLLVAGALFHSGGFKIRASTVGLVLLPGTSLYALATVGGAPSLDGIVFLQTPAMIVASGYCAWRLSPGGPPAAVALSVDGGASRFSRRRARSRSLGSGRGPLHDRHSCR